MKEFELSKFKKSKVLFYGPANTKDKSTTLNINRYHYIIITNNMVNLFFDKHKYVKGKIILLTNQLFTTKYTDVLRKYDDKIYGYFTTSKIAYDILKEITKKEIHILNEKDGVKGTPFGLTRILIYLKPFNYDELYITGVTFYSNKLSIEKNYIDNYMVKEGYEHNVLNKDKEIHNIKSNIEYTKKSMKSNIFMCKELKKILCLI